MRRLLAIAAVAIGVMAVAPIDAAFADGGGCDQSVSFQVIGVSCDLPGGTPPSGTHGTPASAGPPITVVPACGLGAESLCFEPAPCSLDGVSGFLYSIYRGAELLGESCLTEEAAGPQPVVTPGLIVRAFQRLTWPSSDLLVEPPGGRTLVNFATNFHTDNADPSRQTVRLLGRRVTIEATPTTYSWHFGDGTSLDTEHPGSAYPALDITHDYASKGSMSASVDTTYSGRYRVGNGPWLTIPATLTVDGAGVALTVTTARPTLVRP